MKLLLNLVDGVFCQYLPIIVPCRLEEEICTVAPDGFKPDVWTFIAVRRSLPPFQPCSVRFALSGEGGAFAVTLRHRQRLPSRSRRCMEAGEKLLPTELPQKVC